MIDVDVRISSYSKKELAKAVDKRFRVISAIKLFKISKATKELKGTKEQSYFKILQSYKTQNVKYKVIMLVKTSNKTILKYCTHCYVALSNIF